MATSGILCDDSAIEAYKDLKNSVHKYILFDINDAKTYIVVVKKSPKDATFDDFVQDLMSHGACYATYDFKYMKDSMTDSNKIFFVSWCPESSTPIKRKMLQSSSKEALRKKLEGIGKEIQAHDADDITEANFIAQLTDVAAGHTAEYKR